MIPESDSESYWWGQLEQEFANATTALQTLTFEPSPQEAKKKVRRNMRELDEACSLLPYRPTDDRDELRYWHDTALGLIPNLESLFGERQYSAEFIHHWGAFQFSFGILSAANLAGREDPGQIKAGKEGAKKKAKALQRRWIASQLLFLIDRGVSRTIAEKRLAKGIREQLKSEAFPPNFEKAWFDKLICSDGRLISSYRGKSFTVPTMRTLVSIGFQDLPPPVIDSPKP